MDKEVLKKRRACSSVSVYPCHFAYQCSPFMWTDGQPHHIRVSPYLRNNNKREDKMLGTCNFLGRN